MKIKEYIKQNYFILIILVIAAFLRLFNIGFQEPWLDELSTLQVSDPELTYSETNTLIMTREGFSHLYFLSIKYLCAVFGHSIVVLRCFSAFFGLAGIYVLFLFVKELFNKRAGNIAAILLTVSFFHIFHSQEARVYSLMVFFVVLAGYRMMKYIKNPTMLNAIYLGVCSGLIINTHPTGLLNTAVIYATLAVFLLIEKDKLRIFKQLLVAGILTIIIFMPMYWLFSKASEMKSFWIPPASFETIKAAFFELLGSTTYTLYIYLLSVICFFILIIFKIKSEKNTEAKKLKIIAGSLIFFWIILNIGVIIAKSYYDVSIILSRYFIGSLCLFIITLSYCLSLVENRYFRNALLSAFTLFALFTIIDSGYYTTIRKTQWQSLADDIIAKHSAQDKVYGAYGFVSNILFKNSSCYRKMREITFDDYLNSIRANPNQMESFWYFDGNFRPYSLTTENQIFLEENYQMDENIEKKDCWARHYVPKNIKIDKTAQSIALTMDDFDGVKVEGNMYYMFQSGTIKSRVIYLKKGLYEFQIEAMSFPKKPINNENAIIEVKINDLKIWKGQVGSDEKITPIKVQLKVKDNLPKIISISYLNDAVENNEDRNLGIRNIVMRKLN